ncbi:LapA family protein [Nocardioides sp. GXQ0305]|uniref:LapA family protein n=1 Tax=Nocardioides sp. GXQ0305 TaxID=3423912 RepID=UPI003D7CECFE
MSDSQPTPADPGAPRHPSAEDGAPDGAAAPDQTPAAPEAGTSTSRRDPLRGSRTSGVWLAVVAGGVILVLLIIFIAQNTDTVRIRFLGWEGETPLAVALLIATTAGLFLAAVAGSLRILQLRRRVRRDKR